MRKTILSTALILTLFSNAYAESEDKTNTSQPPLDNHRIWTIQQLIDIREKLSKIEFSSISKSDLEKIRSEINVLSSSLSTNDVRTNSKINELAKNQALEIKSQDDRISDINMYIALFGLTLGALSILMTLGAVSLGLSARERAIIEAKVSAEDWLKDNASSVIKNVEESAMSELQERKNYLSEQLNHEIEIGRRAIEALLSESQGKLDSKLLEFDSTISSQLIKLPDHTSREEPNKIPSSPKQKSVGHEQKGEDDYTPKDWYRKCSTLIRKGDYRSALSCIESILVNPSTSQELIARSLLRKGNILDILGQTEEAIETLKSINRIFSESTSSDIKDTVYKSFINIGGIYTDNESYDEAMNVYDHLLDLLSDSKEIDSSESEYIAKVMLAKGFLHASKEDFKKAQNEYDSLYTNYNETHSISIMESIYTGQLTKAAILYKEQKFQDAIKTYDLIIEKTKQRLADSPKIRNIYSSSYINKCISYVELELFKEAISLCDDLLLQFENEDYNLPKLAKAKFRLTKSYALFRANKNKECLEITSLIIDEFRNSNNPETKDVVATALYRKAICLRRLNRFHEEISTYEELEEYCKDITSELSDEYLASSLNGKARAYSKLNMFTEALQLQDKVVELFKDTDNPVISKSVQSALCNAAELSIVCEDRSKTLQRIEHAEKGLSDDSGQKFIMNFLKFIINNTSTRDLVESAKSIGEDDSFDWSFGEIYQSIQKLDPDTREKAIAAIRFFESHRCAETLDSDLHKGTS